MRASNLLRFVRETLSEIISKFKRLFLVRPRVQTRALGDRLLWPTKFHRIIRSQKSTLKPEEKKVFCNFKKIIHISALEVRFEMRSFLGEFPERALWPNWVNFASKRFFSSLFSGVMRGQEGRLLFSEIRHLFSFNSSPTPLFMNKILRLV